MKLRSRKESIRLGAIRQLFKRFAPYLRQHRPTLVKAGLCTLGATAVQLLRPWPLKIVFDVILLPQQEAAASLERFPLFVNKPNVLLGVIALSILGIAVLDGLFGYGRAYLTASVGQKVVASIRRQLYNHVQHLSQSFHDESRTGDVVSRLTTDIRNMRDLLVNSVIYLSDKLLVIVGMLGIMLWIDWQLTLVALAVMPLLALSLTRFADKMKGAARKQRRAESKIASLMTERLSSITLVQAFARAAYEGERFARQNDSSLKAGLVSTRLGANLSRVVQVILAMGIAAALWFGVTRVQAGVLTPGDLLVFVAYVRGLYKPMRTTASLTRRIVRATVCGERILAILDTETEIKDAPNAVEAPRFRGEIVFEGVSFAYQEGVPVLWNAGFRIQPGETVVLVGESGAGKSTIASLLLRLYDPTEGRVLIDGTDIRDYTLTSLREQIAVVLQDSVLFNTTISENIAYGKLDASMEEIVAAARAANAHDFIENLSKGYDTVVGERGDTLSGGQRQRIAIARAVIRKAPLVILDEPTVGLDAESKVKVDEALAHLTTNSTCLIITHDAKAATAANRVLMVRNDGQVIEATGELLVDADRHGLLRLGSSA